VSEQPLLSVEEVHGVSFAVPAGGSVALLGGCAASELALAPLRLTRPSAGRIVFAGQDLLALGDRKLRAILGAEIGAVFADPAGSLHPSYKLGWQLTEAVRAHHRVSKPAARDRAVDALEAVGVPEPRRAVDSRPRSLALDVRLRALIAIALINRPRLLLVDDPFAALDVDGRDSIVELLRALRRRLGFALLLATADAALARALADEVYAVPGAASGASSGSPSDSSSDSSPGSSST
jgi:ABC-type microcin C transport system duplicated ATPase subunit YejF